MFEGFWKIDDILFCCKNNTVFILRMIKPLTGNKVI